MIATFYIIDKSFEQNLSLTIKEIEEKIRLLAGDFVYIRKYKNTNKLFVHPDIYNVLFFNKISISDLLNNEEIANRHLDRDIRVSLKKIIWESELTTHTTQEVIDKLVNEHNEECCYGLIGFNYLEGISQDLQIVYNLKGWFSFKRHYLKLYPKNEIFFIEECKKYFPNLLFHDRNKITIKEILKDFSETIISHLGFLNDRFRESQDGLRNRQETLTHFSINCNLATHASLEGNAARKSKFTYDFFSSKGEKRTICCEPHLKLSHNERSGDTEFYFHRIYFHEGVSDFEENKILIGHIGKHLL
jgi:hypothetical protein